MHRGVKAWFARLSLARKLTAISIVTAGGSLVLACGVFFAYDLSSSRQKLVRDVGMLASGEPQLTADGVPRWASLSDIDESGVVTANGERREAWEIDPRTGRFCRGRRDVPDRRHLSRDGWGPGRRRTRGD